MGLLSSLLLYGMQEWILPDHQQGGRPRPQRDQGPARRSPPTSSTGAGCWRATSASTTSTTSWSGERARARGGRAGAGRRVLGLRLLDLRRGPEDLGPARAALRAAARPGTPATRTYELERGWRRTTGDALVLPAVHQRSGCGRSAATRAARSSRPPTSGARRSPRTRWASPSCAAYIASLESRGFDVAKLRVQLHRKLAFPMVGLVMTLLAVPFSFIVARRGALYGIGIAIVIAIVYWAVLGIFEALGNNALLHPALAAWAPNLAVRRRRALPDPHAGDLTRPSRARRSRDLESLPVEGLDGACEGLGAWPEDPPRGLPTRVRPRRSAIQIVPRVPAFTEAPSRTKTIARVWRGVEPAVGPPVDGAEAGERELDLAPLGRRSGPRRATTRAPRRRRPGSRRAPAPRGGTRRRRGCGSAGRSRARGRGPAG